MIDFVVIGGGIAGLSAGAHLSEQGTVVVLEAEDGLGYHASGRSAALFEPGYGPAPIVALNLASRDHLADGTGGTGGYLVARGLLLIAGEDDRDAFAADVEALGIAPVTPAEAVARVPILNPDRVAAAAWHAGAWDIDTDRLMQDYARVIRGNGGRVLNRARVSGIDRRADGWAVTAHESVIARRLVNAAGAWADQIADLAGITPVGLVPRRRSMARLPAPGGHDVRHWPMLLGAGETWYAKPDAGKLLVSPADADPVAPHDAFADDMTLAQGLARYEVMVTEPVTRVETSWAGLRSFVADGAPVLGPDPDDRDFLWCAGQGGYGFQTAPAAARLLADLAAGNPPALPPDVVAALVPDRLER